MNTLGINFEWKYFGDQERSNTEEAEETDSQHYEDFPVIAPPDRFKSNSLVSIGNWKKSYIQIKT